jgi:hypothetical protein
MDKFEEGDIVYHKVVKEFFVVTNYDKALLHGNFTEVFEEYLTLFNNKMIHRYRIWRTEQLIKVYPDTPQNRLKIQLKYG